jgi:hypothetical protein
MLNSILEIPAERFEVFIKISNNVLARRMATRIQRTGKYIVSVNFKQSVVTLNAGDFIVYANHDIKPLLKEVFLAKYMIDAIKGYKIVNEYIGI